MTLPPKDYIAARRLELNQREQAIKDERAILDLWESGLNPVPKAPVTVFYGGPEEGSPPRRQRFEKSIKQMVLEVMKGGAVMLAQDILHEIKETFGVVVERTSLSPQLTRLKTHLMIDRSDGNYWIITPAGQEYLAQLNQGLDIFSQN